MLPRNYSLEVPILTLFVILLALFGIVAVITTGAVQWKCVEKTGSLCPMEQMCAQQPAAGQVNAGGPR